MEIDRVRAALVPFFENNPEAELVEADSRVVIAHPWGDETIALRVPEDAESLVAALNPVRMPPSLTAVWHTDSQELEILWAPVPTGMYSEVVTRAFKLLYRQMSLDCEFRTASDRVLTIAGAFRREAPPTATSYRNLDGYQMLVHFKRDHPNAPEIGTPVSFWIHGLPWDEGTFPDVARHINFYMKYFDQKSPRILIHEPPVQSTGYQESPRYPLGPFPATISARSLDPYLLGLWESAAGANLLLRFLHLYQILEYAAFYFVRDDIYRDVSRILASPDIYARREQVARQVIECVSRERMTDDQKLQNVVKQFVDPKLVWGEIYSNLSYFSCNTIFDGGYETQGFAKINWTQEDFASQWHPRFIDEVRRIRNALVHSRESRSGAVIAPTPANYKRLEPWLGPLASTANQVILYWEG